MTSNERTQLDGTVPTAPGVDTDDVLEALTAARRRYIIACLRDRSGPVRLADLADGLADWEDGEQGEDAVEDSSAVYTSLYHVHVPKLAAVGLVEYDRERDTVRLAETGDELATNAGLTSVG